MLLPYLWHDGNTEFLNFKSAELQAVEDPTKLESL